MKHGPNTVKTSRTKSAQQHQANSLEQKLAASSLVLLSSPSLAKLVCIEAVYGGYIPRSDSQTAVSLPSAFTSIASVNILTVLNFRLKKAMKTIHRNRMQILSRREQHDNNGTFILVVVVFVLFQLLSDVIFHVL